MSKFKRKLLNIDKLEQLAKSTKGNWWTELLGLWHLPGTDAGTTGLRLAVRDNYLNFYRKGQSVARVHFGTNGEPCASVHLKYLGGADVTKGKEYARLHNGRFTSATNPDIPFVEGKTFLDIISKAESLSGIEKNFVDLTVAQNVSVVDLEIGLPRLNDEGGAPRMDLALLERESSSSPIKLVFWEAKTIDDKRLRATDPNTAKVHEQLGKYMEFMKNEERWIHATKEYRENCRLLLELARMVGKEAQLSPLIAEVANPRSDFLIDPKPRLVIFENRTIKRVKTWSLYSQSLEARWAVQVFDDSTSYALT